MDLSQTACRKCALAGGIDDFQIESEIVDSLLDLMGKRLLRGQSPA